MQVAVGRLQLSLTVADRSRTAPAEKIQPQVEEELSSSVQPHDCARLLLERERARWADANYLRTVWRI